MNPGSHKSHKGYSGHGGYGVCIKNEKDILKKICLPLERNHRVHRNLCVNFLETYTQRRFQADCLRGPPSPGWPSSLFPTARVAL